MAGSGYRDYTSDHTYWTVRTYTKTFWVVRIRKTPAGYEWTEVWGGYSSAGAAAGAAAQLAYAQGARDERDRIRRSLHEALDNTGLGVPEPSSPPIAPSKFPNKARIESE